MQGTMILIPMASSFAITVMFMPLFIGYFHMKKQGQVIREEGPSWHEIKSGTPTMGGFIFLWAIIISAIWIGFWQKEFSASMFVMLFILFLYGALGFADDSVKLFMKRNLGLRAWQKLAGQIIGGLVFVYIFYREGFAFTFDLPFLGELNLGIIIYSLFIIFWLVGFSNAVNLTDGLDGLVSGLGIISYSTYAYIAYDQAQFDVEIFCLTVVGALIGFMIFNHKPAKIFMGDVGSLALGGGLAAVSLLLHREFSLLFIGIVFVAETLSVMLQVASFKLTGKRIFKMSPIHHHFELSGWSEWKVVIVFWSVGIASSLLYLLLY